MTIGTHSSNLPPERRARLTPEFLANERDYFEMRDELMKTHFGQWVAIRRGKLVAASEDLDETFRISDEAGGNAYVAIVGLEEKTVFRVRRAEFDYDRTYRPRALPRIAITFMNLLQTRALTFDDVIPDTGSDVCVLDAKDCENIGLLDSVGLPGFSAGVAGPGKPTMLYRGFVELDGRRSTAYVEAIEGAEERIAGRDVLNRHRILFDGPGGRIVINP